ncbi:hypothetical protein Aduo_010468 [Ancylostoma duodenale]
MNNSTSLLRRPISLENTTLSEFEVVPISGSTAEESFDSNVTTTLEELEQLIQELALGSPSLEKRVGKAEQCIEIARNVEENNRILQKSMQMRNDEAKRLRHEVDQLQKELSLRPKMVEVQHERSSSSAMLYRMNLICSIRVVVLVTLAISVCLV